jgi:hypothetical protein
MLQPSASTFVFVLTSLTISVAVQQDCVLQFCVVAPSKEQSAPPPLGGGFVQVLDWVPPLHTLLHVPQLE